ncbi:MAG TPA: 3-hydroxybutyryl-CoA dehydrogenase [Gemmatimonadales bacterium]|nr:3-hydroxybutyryl-CoA dehydrogenase [Gemmatimonadales bacterium]
MSEIRRVGVLGAGLMGGGIAQVAAAAGHETVVRDVSEAALGRARAAMEKSLGRFVDKGQLAAAERDATLARLAFTTELGAVADADLVIEAVTEDPALKAGLYRELHAAAPEATIFASNTSSLSVVSLAAASGRPDRFVGLHFFNPVPLMALVEVVRAVTTSDATFERALAFARRLGKEPVVARDGSGFIVNRLLVPYLLDAVRALEQGTGSVADMDRAMMLGCGHPMGPFTLLDFVGLDTVVKIGEIMFDEFREPRFAPPPLLRRMVAAGWTGRKGGRGFYDYSVEPPVVAS